MGKILSKPLNVFFFISAFIIVLGPSFSSQQEEIADVLKGCNQAVVTLNVFDSSKKEIAQGKGVIVSPNGLILTNYHLICQGNSAKVQLAEGKISKKVDILHIGGAQTKDEKKKPKGKWVDVEGVVAFDKSLDFALLKIKEKALQVPQLSSSDQFEIGNKTLVVVEGEALSEGAVTNVKELTESKKILQISLRLTPEMSGSPVFDSEAKVIGLASCLAKSSDFVLPVAYALPLLKEEKITSLSKLTQEDFFSTWEGLYLRGMANSIVENYQEALRHLEDSVRANPNQSFAYFQIGFMAEKLNQHEKAAEAYGQAAKMNPTNYKAFFGLGMAYLRLNQLQQALNPLIQASTINPNFPDALYNLGLIYEQLGMLEKAASSYEQFIKVNPGPAWTGYNQLGSVYLKMNKFKNAISCFQETVKTNPSDLKANYGLALAYDMDGQYDQAAPAYRKLISLNPADAKSYYDLLFRMYDRGSKFKEALEVCQEIIGQFPENPNNFYNLGIIYFKLENHEKALEAFQKALTLNPNFDQAYYNIGLVHFKQQKFEEAVKAFTKFTELKPDNPDAYYNIGVGYLQLKKYEEALKPLLRAIELRPDYALAHYNLALAYLVLGDRFSATEELKTVQRLNPDLADKLRKIIFKK